MLLRGHAPLWEQWLHGRLIRLRTRGEQQREPK
jgi:hypothetical protein